MKKNLHEEVKEKLERTIEPYMGQAAYGFPRVNEVDGIFSIDYEIPILNTMSMVLEVQGDDVQINYCDVVNPHDSIQKVVEMLNQIPEKRKSQITPSFLEVYDRNLGPLMARNPNFRESNYHTSEEMDLIMKARKDYRGN